MFYGETFFINLFAPSAFNNCSALSFRYGGYEFIIIFIVFFSIYLQKILQHFNVREIKLQQIDYLRFFTILLN